MSRLLTACLRRAISGSGQAHSISAMDRLIFVGLALHPLQRAFIAHDGFQCGYCTPGQLCSAVGMADEVDRGVPSNVTADLSSEKMRLDRDELRERMSGNLCGCGAHNGIVAAIAETFAKVPA